ncbi:flagellar biosynthetic protein FliR [Neisseriaceae bacterium TC5R-5]|nr:flagellar biosynthetic protein FliR [Neisseriaceae bacterium TC5R-5]
MELSWLYATFLLSIRLTPVFFMTPLLALSGVPGVVKALLALALSACMVSASAPLLPLPDSLWRLFAQVMSELIVGGLLGFGVQALFACLALAGRMIDTQMGFGLAGVIDPMTRQSAALSGMVLELLALAYLYALNAHHLLLQTFAELLQWWPLGQSLSWQGLRFAVAQFGVVFSLGVTLAAPVMLALFVLDVGIALMSRSMPQFNAFILSMPVKVLTGLLLLIALLPNLSAFFARWLQALLHYWAQLAGA